MRIAVMFGGYSMERDVSIASAAKVIPVLRGCGHDVTAVDLSSGVIEASRESAVLTTAVAPDLPAASTVLVSPEFLSDVIGPALQDMDICFLAVHGGVGEDGTIQALLDLAGLQYTGSGHGASAVAMDKIRSKRLFRDAGIPTPAWLETSNDIESVTQQLGWPVVVKPAAEGSTVGLSVVKDPADFEAAVRHAEEFGTVLVEQYIPGRELTVGVLDGKSLAVGEIMPLASEIFDYESKYQPGGAEETFPADVSGEVTQQARRLALAVHESLGLGSYSRVDFRMDHQGNLWCLEANTLPGLTEGSLLPQSAAAAGIAFPNLLEGIIQASLKSGI